MSAARSSRHESTELSAPPADIAELRSRRRHARRTQRLARVDVGLGVAAALVLLIASPGLAIAGLIAALVLAACVISALVQRRRRRRRRRAAISVTAPRRSAGASARRRA
jgi:Flp pilus assembly protein TadB